MAFGVRGPTAIFTPGGEVPAQIVESEDAGNPAAYKRRVLSHACFWPKIGAILQKNRGPTEIILHFFSRFSGFLGFFPLQAIAFQQQAAIQPLQKKSCLKTDGRFSVRSGMCHNRRVNVETTGRNEGCEGWTAANAAPPCPLCVKNSNPWHPGDRFCIPRRGPPPWKRARPPARPGPI